MTSLLPFTLPMHAPSSHCTAGSSLQPVRVPHYICTSSLLEGYGHQCQQKTAHFAAEPYGVHQVEAVHPKSCMRYHVTPLLKVRGALQCRATR